MTWDASGWQETGTFELLDEYRPAVTSVPEGDALVETYIVYVLDYTRGLDVLRFHDDPEEPPAPGSGGGGADLLDPGLPGLRPDQPPANPRRLLPGMLDGEQWRC